MLSIDYFLFSIDYLFLAHAVQPRQLNILIFKLYNKTEPWNHNTAYPFWKIKKQIKSKCSVIVTVMT